MYMNLSVAMANESCRWLDLAWLIGSFRSSQAQAGLSWGCPVRLLESPRPMKANILKKEDMLGSFGSQLNLSTSPIRAREPKE